MINFILPLCIFCSTSPNNGYLVRDVCNGGDVSYSFSNVNNKLTGSFSYSSVVNLIEDDVVSYRPYRSSVRNLTFDVDYDFSKYQRIIGFNFAFNFEDLTYSNVEINCVYDLKIKPILYTETSYIIDDTTITIHDEYSITIPNQSLTDTFEQDLVPFGVDIPLGSFINDKALNYFDIYNNGYQVGYENGVQSGNNEGYTNGYNQGLSDAQSPNIFNLVFNAFGGVMSWEIFPGFHFGYVVGFGFFVLLVKFILSFFI